MSDYRREAGVLCHISSLPGKYGIGSLGKAAYRFAEKLAKCGVGYWQILPLVQTGYGDSPYSSVACNSGNPYFIDLETLQKQKLLTSAELKGAEVAAGNVDYGMLYATRYPLLRRAFSRFNLDGEGFRAFVKQGEYEDYALYMTAKTVYGDGFSAWPEQIRRRDPAALESLRTSHHEEYLFWQFLQYEFRRQWNRLRDYANGLGVSIIGDIPLYVAADSADVWAHPQLFRLNEDLSPKKVAGVPPDYFCATGQLWGNPVYDWEGHKEACIAWWRRRLLSALDTYNIVRIDHFRGLDRYYEVDAGAENAIAGTWQDGPKKELFASFSEEERRRIIAEDLGDYDESVQQLLRTMGFPGMKILLFAFDGNPDNTYLPSNIGENCVIYTGTHDNSTVAGYLSSLSAEEYILFKSRVAAEMEHAGLSLPLNESPKSFCTALIALALCSKARLAVIPVQDLLCADDASRMNRPGILGDNWMFRLEKFPPRRVMKLLKKAVTAFGRKHNV